MKGGVAFYRERKEGLNIKWREEGRDGGLPF